MRRPKLIIIGGSLATGKSTVAKYLEEQTGIKRISMDELKERLFDIGGHRDREWSKGIGRLGWPVFCGMIEMQLERRNDVIAEATFLWSDDADWINQLAQKFEGDIFQIWMTADPKIARERFVYRANNERHPGHNDQVDHVIEEFDERFFNRTFEPQPLNGKTLVVDTSDFDTVNKEAILNFLAEGI